MKLFSIFMLVFTLGTQASGYSQKQLVTLNLKQCDINTLFQEIWKQTGLRFVYNEEDIADFKHFDIQANQEQADEILNRIFNNTPYECSYESDVIYITSRRESNSQQTKQERVTLSGTIQDKNGNPLPGVTVFIGNSDIGTSSDIYGNYQLSILYGNSVDIVYSFIGMKKVTYHFAATENVRHNVVMEEDQVKLEDVVVIGYGSQSKRNVTSAISSVKGDELQKSSGPALTFDNMLGGAIKGVMVTQNSGQPGASATVNIRGITSPYPNYSTGSSNEPLYVIDGIPFFNNKYAANPFSIISPNDIQSIDVLKDAAATSIYGSRGANGVVIIKTKNGHRNEKMTISAGYTFTVANPTNNYTPLNTTEFKNMQTTLIKNTLSAMNNGYVDDYGMVYDVMNYANTHMDESGNYIFESLSEEAYGNINTNWVKEVQNKNAITHQYDVALRGGSQGSNYSFSFNAIDQEGLYINDKLKRYNTRLSVDTDISKRFKGGAALNYTYTQTNYNRQMFADGETPEWLVRPDQPVRDENGKFHSLDGTPVYGYPVGIPNPVAVRQNKNNTNTYQFLGSSYLEYSIIEGLKVRGDINLIFFQSDNDIFTPQVAMEDYSQVGSSMPSTLNNSIYNNFNSSVNFRADYDWTKNMHHIHAMVGYGWDHLRTKGSSLTFSGFPDDKILTDINSASNAEYYSSSKTNSGLNSVYARIGYNYEEKYLAEINFRSDVSSKFGPGNQRAYFPALSLGWRINSEEFLKNTSWIDDLKVRFSFGQTGSTNVDDFTYKQFFTRTSTSYWGGLATVGLKKVLPNRNVKWEMTTEYNGGVDFTFFERKIFGSIDAYYRYTDGALTPAPAPLESGMSDFTANLIDMSNKGVEIELGSNIIQTQDWNWMLKFNIAFNRNKIEKLKGANIGTYIKDYFTEGKPAGTLKGFIVEKIFDNQEEIDQLNQKAIENGYTAYRSTYTGVGDYKFRDANNDYQITSDDKEILATPEPKFFGGLFNQVSYKNLSLSFMFQFSKGAKAFLNTMLTSAQGSLGQSVVREFYNNTYSENNTDARYARLLIGDPNGNSYTSDRYVFETSYMRLKNITLSYTIPQSILHQFNIQNIQVFATASNLWTITKWPGIDPELVGSGTTLNTRNNDPYPLSKTFSVGLRLQF